MWAAWALALLRVWLGILFTAHGMQKGFGLFGGEGFDRWTATVGRQGIGPARFYATLGVVVEFGGGLCLIAGIATPIAAGALATVMVAAILMIHGRNGFWNTRRGFEFPLSLLVALVVIGIGGPGALAVDQLLLANYNLLVPVAFAVVLLTGLLFMLMGRAHVFRRKSDSSGIDGRD